MPSDPIPRLVRGVSERRLCESLFHLAKNPLPFRKLNYTLPGHAKSTLEEADDFIAAQLESWGYAVEREGCLVQAFRCDVTKPKVHQYGAPRPDDRWYVAHNLYARKSGSAGASPSQPRARREAPASRRDSGKLPLAPPCQEETILLCAHKDSQSWVDSPGAYDNAVGTVALMEIARVLAKYRSRRSFCFLFCNEEHRPWTSITAARNARIRGDNLMAIFNLDGLAGKSQADIDAGRKPLSVGWTELPGEPLADLVAEADQAYGIGLTTSKARRVHPGDDDGSFIQEGFSAAVVCIGSIPYGDPNYHLETDRAEFVDTENLRMATQAVLAAVVRVDTRNP